jgi:EpsD family peptidyl-prolyl cis-trans isomerase
VKHSIVAAVCVCGILVTGCQRKAEGQTVAVVNGQEITVPELNFALSQAKVPEGADKDAVRAQVLQELINAKLLSEQAKSEGIDKSPEYLNRQRLADEQLLISMLRARRLNTVQLPSDREAQEFIAAHPGMFANRETWDLDLVAYTTPKDPAIMAEIQKTKTIDQLIAVLQSHSIQFKRQKSRMDSAALAPNLYPKVNALPAGEPFVLRAGDKSVASAIIGRTPNPLSGDQAKPAAVALMRNQQTNKTMEGLLKSLKASAKIEYQPGYAPKKG